MKTPVKIYHISLTGIYAGQTLCGKAPKEGEVKAHAGKWLDNPELTKCQECLELWNGDDET